MEFPFPKQAPTMQTGGSSVNKSVSPIPNSNPKSFEIFERRSSVEASSQGLRHFNAIDLGGSGDGKRDMRSIAMSFGQGNPAGDNAPVNGVDSEIMLSLDEILDDLHKKVVSVDVNEFGAKGNSANPLGFGSRNPMAEGGASSLSQRNEQQKGRSVGVPYQHEDVVAGSVPGLQQKGRSVGAPYQHEGVVAVSVPGLHATGDQMKGSVPVPSAMGEQFKDAVRSGVGGERYNGEVAGPQANQLKGEVANLRGASEQYKGEAAAVQGIVEPYNEGASGSLQTNEQGTEEVTGSVGINDQSDGVTAGSVAVQDQSMGQATGSVAIHDQSKGQLPAQSDKALGPVVGGALDVLSTPRRGRQISRKITEIIQSPDWLPNGWFTELKTRETGSSAGTKDKYFYDPVSQRRFRSRAEVFSFLETGKIARYKPKVKSEGEIGRKRKVSGGLFENAASFDRNLRPTKVRWVLNDSEGSWIPFINEEDLNGFNSKEGECIFDLNRNSADAYDHVQGEATVLKDTSLSTRLKSKISKSRIRPSTRKKVPKGDLPLIDPWSDPCLEFAVQTLAGAIPNLEENLALSHALQNYFVTPATPLQILGVDSGKSIALHSDKHPIYQLRNNFTKNTISGSDSLPGKELISCTHSCRQKQLTRQDTKDLLEHLGRKLCNQALNFLKGHKLSKLFVEKRSNSIVNS